MMIIDNKANIQMPGTHSASGSHSRVGCYLSVTAH